MLRTVRKSVSEISSFSLQFIESPIGLFRARWSTTGLWSFEFDRAGDQSEFPDVACKDIVSYAEVADRRENRSESVSGDMPSAKRFAHKLESAVHQYFRCGNFAWNLDELDWQGVSSFNRDVLQACHGIPPGSVLTYGQLAAIAGHPKAARAVGRAMAGNRWPLIIPCHRVVGSGGSMTGYSGRGGVETKRNLLKLEGFSV